MSRRPSGFTLLEVMCAFVLMATLISFVVEIWHESMDKAGRAADTREIREVSDTVFGRILFEHQVGKFRDGDGGTLDGLYGQWARLSSQDRERYERYEWRLEIRAVQAAGQAPEGSDAEPLTGDAPGELDAPSGSAPPDAEEAPAGGELLERITLRIRYQPEFRTSGDPDEDLIVLSRLMPPPPDLAGAGARPPAGGSR